MSQVVTLCCVCRRLAPRALELYRARIALKRACGQYDSGCYRHWYTDPGHWNRRTKPELAFLACFRLPSLIPLGTETGIDCLSIAGLKFHSGSTGDRVGNLLETKSGSYIYWGDPASFHDWKFRTELRIKLYDQAQTQQAKKQDPADGPADEGEPWPPESDEGFAFPSPGHYPEEFEPEPRETAGPPKSKACATSPKASSVKSDKSSIIDRSVLVNKIVEGLRGDAFLLARDLGLETLARPGGLERLVEVICNHVFPRALEESKELFRAEQKLSRQPTESMLSYTQRRRRWWTLLVELDPTMMISEAFRTELLLEMSGISRQEILVVKASCRKSDDFEGTARVLVDNYSGIHLREGSRSWTGRGIQPQVGKGKGYQKGYQGKGKGS